VARFYQENPNGNYYDDMLAAEFARSSDPSRPTHAGDWNLHFPRRDDPRNVAMFASGLGDGSYSAIWGVANDEQPTMLVVDFELLEEAGDER
jgi:hypothetical protein